MMRFKSAASAFLAIAVVLAACGQPAQPAPQANDGMVSLRVAFDRGSTAAEELRPMGLPFNPADGSIAVDDVIVYVTDRDGQPVKFNSDGTTFTADPNGSYTSITLTPDTTSGKGEAAVLLPAAGNPYTFESLGRLGADVIGYGTLLQHVSVNSSVVLQLKSVLGSSSLTPRYPTNFATPGADLDLMLTVSANEHPELQVPISDFSSTYAVTAGSVVTESNRGVRITVDNACAKVEVTSTSTGILEQSGKYGEGDTSTDFSLDCVQPNQGNLYFDHEAPVVTISSFDSLTGHLQGEANDNVAISKVQVFDGVEIVASTDIDEIANGAAEIFFPAGGTTFHAYLASGTSGTGSLQAIALDSSGNEGRSEETQNPLFVYVDDDAAPGGKGTAESPFNTVGDGYNAVAEGGVVYVLDGTYDFSSLTLKKDGVTLRGESEGGTVFNVTGGYGIEVNGDNVTLEHFTLKGPSTTTQARGIHAAPDSVQTDILQGLLIRHVTVDGARQIGISINTTNGTALQDVTVKNVQPDSTLATIEGIGINIKTSENVSLNNVVTQNNGIGISIETASPTNDYAQLDIRNVTITGGSQNDTFAGIMTEIYPGRVFTGLSLDSNLGYQYAVRNSTSLKARDSGCSKSGGQYTYYVTAIEDATELSPYFCDDGASTTVQDISATDASVLYDFYVPVGLAIQVAVDAANPGATINVLAGTHSITSEIALNKRITLSGDAANTVLAVSAASGIDVVNGGAGSSIENLQIELQVGANYGIELSAPASQNITVSGVQITGHGATLDGGVGIKVASKTDASGFVMNDVTISQVKTGLYVEGQAGTTVFSGITLSDVTISGAADKGIYAEALDNANFSDVEITDAGNVGNSGGKNGAGISLNILSGPARNITISNSSVTDSGASVNGGGAAISLKSGTDVVFDGVTIVDTELSNTDASGSGVALRVGEPPPTSNSPGPTNVTVRDSTLEGAQHALANHTNSPVTLDAVTLNGSTDGPTN